MGPLKLAAVLASAVVLGWSLGLAAVYIVATHFGLPEGT